MDTNIFNNVCARIKSYDQDVVDIETRLTAIKAMGPENGGDGEFEKSKYIKTLLKQLSAGSLEQIDAPDERVSDGIRPNLFFTIPGKSHKKTIWIMSHMDVVAAGDLSLWDSDPFTVKRDGDKLFGRGTEDDQQGFVSSFLAVKALQEEGVTPPYDIGLAIVADEEAGSTYGIDYVLNERANLFKKEDLIIIPDAGDE